MRFYIRQHRFYCGVDFHARSMYVCVLDAEGNVLVSKDIAAAPGDRGRRWRCKEARPRRGTSKSSMRRAKGFRPTRAITPRGDGLRT